MKELKKIAMAMILNPIILREFLSANFHLNH